LKINEIVFISGKGGTGKTSLVSSMVPYIDNLIIADCDVDAPDFHILFDNSLTSKEEFVGLKKAVTDKSKCIECGTCKKLCKFDAISDGFEIIESKCEGCGVCEYICPERAIEMKDAVVGQIFLSKNKYAEMVHAELIPGEETSGRLVSEVRKRAKKIAQEKGIKNILIDGSPGTACNVISSITGATKVVIVIEPTVSGYHDLTKVYKVTKKFNLDVFVIINKFDISEEQTCRIENYCSENNIEVLVKIPFDKIMVEAIVNKEIPSIYAHDLFEKLKFKKKVVDKLI
jgi:MinD superfamily P-loop ATPase